MQSNQLILISGPSGVGKGPIIDTLFIYANANGISISKHVLYTNREKRTGEIDGETYHYVDTATLEGMQNRNPNGFKKFNVHEQIQGINIETLKNELLIHSLVILEIFFEQTPEIASFCRDHDIYTKSVFIKPLSEDDYQSIGCTDDYERELVTKAVMQTKLTNRATETHEKVLKRADSAFLEIKNHKGYDFDLVNHYGEDNRYLWDSLKIYASKPRGLEKALTDNTLKGIASMFSLFVTKILS
jgi:guanylate kinase